MICTPLPNIKANSKAPIESNELQNNIVNSIGRFKRDNSSLTLFINGKLSFIYIGAEFCPYCAMEQWAIVMALENFGNFSNLSNLTSAEDNVATYNFIGSNYTSQVVDFQPVEIADNTAPPNQKSLQTLNTLQESLFNKYSPQGYFPFICIGGSIFEVGAGPSFNLNAFSGIAFSTISSQISAKSGSLYNAINIESGYIIQLINQVIENPHTQVNTTTSATSSLSTANPSTTNSTFLKNSTFTIKTSSLPDFTVVWSLCSILLGYTFKKRKNKLL